ncbi:MAG: hypothetical protein N0C81_06125 [Candidatus Thiodiazotropha lotti]|uniref:Uncharacterized protein n=1 Tax=Candidatus Thiodiazotropha lotti TaxID=2792787 RepID=A0A9E4N1C1_9GAMM|nr:hypothetical protein [Candidatus Thiodiazotropha lotti]MCG7930118.1 hypothetical protein [Candidatus Thiodiazotropha lotti]MCG7940816.1 hypothetical protein [Candidatus Thiodiazotropha lotti]MCG8002866.1 hypothetical protein [Candidatus Thiodiazotropha lotti]MCG8007212.1 hypothetical protein [Candidatus Thiodiazotropha lotti]
MDNTLSRHGNVTDGSVLSPSSLDGLDSRASNSSQMSSSDLKTTGERIAGSLTTEDRLTSTPSTSEKLTGAVETSAIRTDEIKQVEETWEKLRSYPEIKAIEDKVGRFKITIDYSQITGYNADENEIIINPDYVKAAPYKTVMNESIENSLVELPEKEYWEFMDNYPESYPFSFERQLVHEAHHALQPDYQLLYDLNPSQFEEPVIKQTNEFMWNHFKEPARDPNWH